MPNTDGCVPLPDPPRTDWIDGQLELNDALRDLTAADTCAR